MKSGKRLSWTYCAVLALLSGCMHTQVREVRIPIPVPCVTEIPVRPALTFEKLPKEAPVFPQVQALLVDRERMGSYEKSLEALLEACR